MYLDRRIKIQMGVFTTVAAVAGAVMIFGYIQLPQLWFGVGQYTVSLELPQAAGLYKSGNVTYRGTEVGRVDDVHLTDDGVAAVLTLNSGIPIPSDLTAEVHSVSAAGEQYVALLPRNGTSPPLKDGDVIPVSRTSVPPAIDSLFNAANSGLMALPKDSLATTVDESYSAVGGLGPEIRRFVQGSTQLAIDARADLDSLTTLIDDVKPILNSQIDTSDSIQAWAAHLATITDQLETHDADVAGVLKDGSGAAAEGKQLFERLQLTLPVLLANLVTLGEVAVTYQPAIEQVLVLLPQNVAAMQGGIMTHLHTPPSYQKGINAEFNLNVNVPPPCTTGFLPNQQRRAPTLVDYPDRPEGDLYCRTPQDSPFGVRSAKNFPCLTVPGKRAPTVKMCESDENYVPLNDGFNWKGDQNATTSGQAVPQLPPGAPAPAAAAPIAVAEYDPATGTYLGPDGREYTQSDLANTAPKEPTWQNMLVPPTG